MRERLGHNLPHLHSMTPHCAATVVTNSMGHVIQLVMKVPAFNRNQRFITMYKSLPKALCIIS